MTVEVTRTGDGLRLARLDLFFVELLRQSGHLYGGVHGVGLQQRGKNFFRFQSAVKIVGAT